MFRRVFLFAATAALVALAVPVSGAEKPDAKQPQLDTITVINGFAGDVADVRKLPLDARLLAEALKHKDATYQIEDNQLKIGIAIDALKEGVVLERIEVQSDCPDNTQYHVTTQLAKREKALRATTIAWTRARHNAPNAPLRIVNVSARGDLKRNFDVQLELNKVSLLDRPRLE